MVSRIVLGDEDMSQRDLASAWRTRTLDHSGTSPLWRQIADDLTEQTEKGLFSAGDKLSNLPTLAAMYDVSPHTISRAMRHLTGLGIVVIAQGRGTFVAHPRAVAAFTIERINNPTGITQILASNISDSVHSIAFTGRVNDLCVMKATFVSERWNWSPDIHSDSLNALLGPERAPGMARSIDVSLVPSEAWAGSALLIIACTRDLFSDRRVTVSLHLHPLHFCILASGHVDGKVHL